MKKASSKCRDSTKAMGRHPHGALLQRPECHRPQKKCSKRSVPAIVQIGSCVTQLGSSNARHNSLDSSKSANIAIQYDLDKPLSQEYIQEYLEPDGRHFKTYQLRAVIAFRFGVVEFVTSATDKLNVEPIYSLYLLFLLQVIAKYKGIDYFSAGKAIKSAVNLRQSLGRCRSLSLQLPTSISYGNLAAARAVRQASTTYAGLRHK